MDNLSVELDDNLVLNRISFEVKHQETLVVMGKNGAGKSVLLKALMGLFPAISGSSSIFGKNISTLSKSEKEDVFSKIGYVFQKSGLFDSMSVEENILFPIRKFQKFQEEELHSIAQDCLHRAGLENSENKLPSELSGGMQKRAGIARAIATNPQLLVLDDPVAGLDPVLTDTIAELILELKNTLQPTVILATHDLHFAYKLADKIALMINGRLYGVLSTEEFKTTSEPYFYQFREGLLDGPIPVIE